MIFFLKSPLSLSVWTLLIGLHLVACDPGNDSARPAMDMTMRMALDQDPGPPAPYIDGGTSDDSAVAIDRAVPVDATNQDATNQDATRRSDATIVMADMGIMMPLGGCGQNQISCMKQNITENCECLIGFGGGDNGVYMGGILGTAQFVDLDNDGDLDAIAAVFADFNDVFDGNRSIQVLINQGDGRAVGPGNGSFFRPIGSTYVSTHPVEKMLVKPVFGERPDILLIGGGQISIYRNIGNGIFAPMNMPLGEFNGSYGSPMDIGDLDGDGDTDIVVSTTGPITERELVILSQGEDGFSELDNRPGLWQEGDPAAHVDDGPISIVIADYDNNNQLDIIRLRAGGDYQLDLTPPPGPLDVLLNRGNGMFESQPIADFAMGSVIHKEGIFASQFESDGEMRLCLFGSAVFGTACSVTPQDYRLLLRTIINRVDVLTGGRIFHGQGAMGFRPATSLSAPLVFAQPFAVLDAKPLLGGPDGRLNLISLDGLGRFMFSHRMAIPGVNDDFALPEAGYQIETAKPFENRLVADFNGDGRDDIALGLPGLNGLKVRVLPSDETGVSRNGSDFLSVNREVIKGLLTIHLTTLVDGEARTSERPSVAAIIGPPDADRVCPASPRAADLDSVAILRNTGADEMVPFNRMDMTRNLMPLCATGYAVGDVNGDGIEDLVATGRTDSDAAHRFYVLEGDLSTSGFPNRNVDDQVANPTIGHLAGIAKLDDDRHGDALTIEPDGSQAWVYWGPQLGASGIPFNGLGKIHAIAALDVIADPEDRPEILIGHTNEHGEHWVSIYGYAENRSFTQLHQLPVMAATAQFAVHDIDLNGLKDLVVSTFCDTTNQADCGRHGLSVLVADGRGGFTENIHQAIGWANVGHFRNAAELDIIQYTDNDYESPRILQGSTSEL